MTPDGQVALLNKLMREHIAPHLPAGMGATLLVFPVKQQGDPESRSIVSYISSGAREDMRESMRKLLQKWDYEEGEREKKTPTLVPHCVRPRDYGDLMTLAEFDEGQFNSDDGTGYLATVEGQSKFDAFGPRYPWSTHVMWYNK